MSRSVAIDPEWVDRQVSAFASRREAYLGHAELLRAVLGWLVGPVCPSAHVSTRAKSLASFAGKIIKRIQMTGIVPPERPWQCELTPDLSAGRVVVHLREQVTELEAKLHGVFASRQRYVAESQLEEDQFGYRALHHLGKLRIDALASMGFFESTDGADWKGKPLDAMAAIECEVQLVTLAQNVWESFTHDRQYKTGFVLPRVWARQSYRIAALMELVDDEVEEIAQGIKQLGTNVGRYLQRDEAVAEVQRLEAVARHAPDDEALIARLVRTQILLGDFDGVIDRLESRASLNPRLKSELGFALCCRENEDSSAYAKGLKLLETSSLERPEVETLTRIARLSTCGDLQRRELWRRAYLAGPNDPTALAGFLRHEMAYTHEHGVAQLLGPNIEAARGILRQQVTLEINLPDALFLLAQLNLIQGQPYEALYRLCQAINLTPQGAYGEELLARIDEEFEQFQHVRPAPVGLIWCLWTIELLRAARRAGDGAVELSDELRRLAGASIAGPVVIVAGGCDRKADVDWARFGELVAFSLEDFAGTLVSGGTDCGVGRIVGDTIEASAEKQTGFCWLPAALPTGTRIDER